MKFAIFPVFWYHLHRSDIEGETTEYAENSERKGGRGLRAPIPRGGEGHTQNRLTAKTVHVKILRIFRQLRDLAKELIADAMALRAPR